jgi:hypothetical protein
MFAMTMLLCLPFAPAVVLAASEQIYDEAYTHTVVDIPYGNGIDDDNDGEIDETDGSEPDVYYGTKDVTTGNSTIGDSWYTNYLMNGVSTCAGYDELWEMDCSDNVSISPTQTCYQLDTIYNTNPYGSYTNASNVINIVTFYVKIGSNKLMNGASEFWYRSPIRWDPTVYDYSDVAKLYPESYLNIYDDAGNIVWASPSTSVSGSPLPYPRVVTDRSGVPRIYYKVDMNFKTDVTYRFEEYVETDSNNPLNSVQLFMARQQDIASDGLTDTYIFWGTTHARKIATECSWSIIFTIGKGLQGGEKILFGGGTGNYSITTQWFSGSTSINNTKSLHIVFPLRTTRPLDIEVYYRIRSGPAGTTLWLQDASASHITGATGTLIYAFNVTDPDITHYNWYQIKFVITNFDEDYTDHNGAVHNKSQNALTFYMYPSAGSGIDSQTNPYAVCMITNDTGVVEPNHFFCHIEMAGESAGYVATSGSSGPNWWAVLVGIGILIIGLILIASVIGATIGIPMLFSGVTIATGICLAGGVGAVALGTALIWEGAGGVSLNQLYSGLAAGTVRVFNAVIKGIRIIGGIALAVARMAIDVVTRVIYLTWRAYVEILSAIQEIIYFIVFIAILAMWSWFLTLMKYILKGDIEGAWAAVKKPLRFVERRSRKFIGAKYLGKKQKGHTGSGSMSTGKAKTYTSTGVFEK